MVIHIGTVIPSHYTHSPADATASSAETAARQPVVRERACCRCTCAGAEHTPPTPCPTPCPSCVRVRGERRRATIKTTGVDRLVKPRHTSPCCGLVQTLGDRAIHLTNCIGSRIPSGIGNRDRTTCVPNRGLSAVYGNQRYTTRRLVSDVDGASPARRPPRSGKRVSYRKR